MSGDCKCRSCIRDRGDAIEVAGMSVPVHLTRMILCQKCGNKRCPHANDHRNECTRSNATGQQGSAYP